MRHVLFLIASASLAGCIHNPDPNSMSDAGTGLADMSIPDVPSSSVYDPILGMPITGDLLLDDQRVRDLDPAQLPAAVHACRPPVMVMINYGVDGDTIIVDELGGDMTTSEHVRFIGVNSPEVMHGETPADCYGPEARDFTRGLAGHVAWLSFGDTCVDIYDRTLAFLNFGTGQNDMFQHQLLRRGYARLYTFSDNNTFATSFEADAEVAQSDNVGLWQACR
jgi:endonuclease YncB( thermonuclease family)